MRRMGWLRLALTGSLAVAVKPLTLISKPIMVLGVSCSLIQTLSTSLTSAGSRRHLTSIR